MAGGGIAIIILIYILSLVPLLVFCSNIYYKRLPKPVVYLYLIGFLLTAFGWELWWTFGLVPPGQDVDHRRCPPRVDTDETNSNCIENIILPQEINWVAASFFDAGIVCMFGLWFVLKVWDRSVLIEWHWKVFFAYLIIFVGQNLIVELLMSRQLSREEGKDEIFVSWAPLSPIGPGWNPSIRVIGEARLSLQNQLPWTLMTPIFYGCCILVYRRDASLLLCDKDDIPTKPVININNQKKATEIKEQEAISV